MKKILKDNRGSITTIVTVTALFFSIILSTAYMVASTNRKTQLKSELTARETYEKPLNNLDEIREEVTGLPRTAETQPYFPSSDFKRISGTDLSNGLVIEDSNGNQYVWVEVPKNEDVYPTAGLNIVSFTDAEYTKIENDLHTYTSVYRNGTTYSDTWVADNDNEGWYTENEYYAQKKKMLKSVYQNGGFYVGRYEAGITEARTEHGYTSVVPMSKANLYPYNYVMRTQANVLAAKVNSGNKNCSLMFGVQWDLIMAFMHKRGNISDELLTKNSEIYGNYCNSTFKLNRGKYIQYSKYTINSTWKPITEISLNYIDQNLNKLSQTEADGILLTTGSSEQNKICNIYDMAGNVWEWTLEKTSSDELQCAERGGSFPDSSSNVPMAARNANYITLPGDLGNLGFRVSIY